MKDENVKNPMMDLWNNWSKNSQFFETSFRTMYETVLSKEDLERLTKASDEALLKVAELNKVASELAIKAMTPPGFK